MAMEEQAVLTMEGSFFAACANAAFFAKMTCSEGCQACISVPAAEFGPAAVNSSALKTPRFPCRCWGFGVFGQALRY
jgi:hypothetical protein